MAVDRLRRPGVLSLGSDTDAAKWEADSVKYDTSSKHSHLCLYWVDQLRLLQPQLVWTKQVKYQTDGV